MAAINEIPQSQWEGRNNDISLEDPSGSGINGTRIRDTCMTCEAVRHSTNMQHAPLFWYAVSQVVFMHFFHFWVSGECVRSAQCAKFTWIHWSQTNSARPPLTWSPSYIEKGETMMLLWKPHTVAAGFETGTHAWLARQSGAQAIAPRPFLWVSEERET